MAKVTFEDKESVREVSMPDKNVVKAEDVNALKNSINTLYPDAKTGVDISFSSAEIYNSPASPATGDITNDLTNAEAGIVQKIYHNDGSAPSVPAGWVLLGSGTYTDSVLNIIFAEWVSGTRVEYWIIQEQ